NVVFPQQSVLCFQRPLIIRLGTVDEVDTLRHQSFLQGKAVAVTISRGHDLEAAFERHASGRGHGDSQSSPGHGESGIESYGLLQKLHGTTWIALIYVYAIAFHILAECRHRGRGHARECTGCTYRLQRLVGPSTHGARAAA